MLVLTEHQVEAIAGRQAHDLLVRVDRWLPEMLSGWGRMAPDHRRTTLRELFQAAEQHGWEIEVDVALFCWIMLCQGPDWRRLHGRADVQQLLADPSWNPASRLVALQDLAMPAGALRA